MSSTGGNKKKTNITNFPDYKSTYLFVDQGVRLTFLSIRIQYVQK